MNLPNVNGQNWTVDQPHKHKRYSWENDTWVFVIRDLGTPTLWRLHARRKATGETMTFGLHPHSPNSQDGFQPLYGAAHRLVAERMHPTDNWQIEAFPNTLNHLF